MNTATPKITGFIPGLGLSGKFGNLSQIQNEMPMDKISIKIARVDKNNASQFGGQSGQNASTIELIKNIYATSLENFHKICNRERLILVQCL